MNDTYTRRITLHVPCLCFMAGDPKEPYQSMVKVRKKGKMLFRTSARQCAIIELQVYD